MSHLPNRAAGTAHFPSLVTRVFAAVYEREPLPADLPETELLALARRLAARRGLSCCVVLAPDRCVYVDPDGAARPSASPPSGGLRLWRTGAQ